MADLADTLVPGFDLRAGFERPAIAADVQPERMETGEIGDRNGVAADPFVGFEPGFQIVQQGVQYGSGFLALRRADRRALEQADAVLDEARRADWPELEQHRGEQSRRGHRADRREERLALGLGHERRGVGAHLRGIERRAVQARGQFPRDERRIAEDVGTDLGNGDATVAARERVEAGPRGLHRTKHGRPLRAGQPEHQPDLFGVGRAVVMVENQRVVHGYGFSRVSNSACLRCHDAARRQSAKKPHGIWQASIEKLAIGKGAAACAVVDHVAPPYGRRRVQIASIIRSTSAACCWK